MTPQRACERHALVLGAGLAGAAVCAALARQGWRLTLLDAAPGPGQAASALPVGMLSLHVTRSPTPLSRLSALGVASTVGELQRLVPVGAGWQPVEVDNRGHDPGRWPSALVRPGALVAAWLSEAATLTSLQTHWNARVQCLKSVGPGDGPGDGPAAGARQAAGPARWQALGDRGAVLAEAPCLVVATALGSRALLERSPGFADPQDLPLHPVKGQLSLAGLHEAPVAERPLRDSGVFVPAYHDSGLMPRWPNPIWAMGSTYERGQTTTETSSAAHERNLAGLRALCPAGAQQMMNAWQTNQLLGWAAVRCASLDRLPLVGAVPDASRLALLASDIRMRRNRRLPIGAPRLPGLYLLTALGSRGLTLAHWCALQLAGLMQAAWQVDSSAAGEAIADAEPAAAAEPAPSGHDRHAAQGPPAGHSEHTVQAGRTTHALEAAELMAALDPARFAWKRLRAGPG